MAIRELRYNGDEILRKRSREVEVVDDRIREILNDMDETMHADNGVGLAAVQVGILKRLVVINKAWLYAGKVDCRYVIGRATKIGNWILVSVIQMKNTI